MKTRIQELREQRDALLAEAGDLVRSADDLEGPALERFEQIETDLDALKPELQGLEDRAKRLDDLKRNLYCEYPGTPNVDRRDYGNDVRGRALSHLESREQPQRNEKIIEAAVQMIERDASGKLAERAAVTGDPDYCSAFLKLIRDPNRGHLAWTADEQGAWARADSLARASESNTGTGAALVPFALDPSVIITGTGSINPIRQVARVVPVSTNAWHGVAAGQVSASFDQEMAEVSDDSPTFVQPTVTEFMMRVFIPASLELIDDVPTLADEIGRLFADAVDNLERDKFTNGSGTNEPKGVVYAVENTTASRVAVMTTGTFGQVDLYKLIEALPPRHQDAAQWMASLPLLNKIRQFATGSGPQSAFWTDWAGPALAPAKLLGQPIWQNSAMTTTVTTGADFLLVGNFQQFLIADHAGGARMEIVPHLFGTTNGRPIGMRGYFMYKRTGSNVTDADAFRILRA